MVGRLILELGSASFLLWKPPKLQFLPEKRSEGARTEDRARGERRDALRRRYRTRRALPRREGTLSADKTHRALGFNVQSTVVASPIITARYHVDGSRGNSRCHQIFASKMLSILSSQWYRIVSQVCGGLLRTSPLWLWVPVSQRTICRRALASCEGLNLAPVWLSCYCSLYRKRKCLEHHGKRWYLFVSA